jgi:hypothetical protein
MLRGDRESIIAGLPEGEREFALKLVDDYTDQIHAMITRESDRVDKVRWQLQRSGPLTSADVILLATMFCMFCMIPVALRKNVVHCSTAAQGGPCTYSRQIILVNCCVRYSM